MMLLSAGQEGSKGQRNSSKPSVCATAENDRGCSRLQLDGIQPSSPCLRIAIDLTLAYSAVQCPERKDFGPSKDDAHSRWSTAQPLRDVPDRDCRLLWRWVLKLLLQSGVGVHMVRRRLSGVGYQYGGPELLGLSVQSPSLQTQKPHHHSLGTLKLSQDHEPGKRKEDLVCSQSSLGLLSLATTT